MAPVTWYTSAACNKGSGKCWAMHKMNSTCTAFLHGFRAAIFQAAKKLTVSTGSCKPCFSNLSLPWHPHILTLALQKPPAPPTDTGLRPQKPNSHLKLFYVVISFFSPELSVPQSSCPRASGAPSPLRSLTRPWPQPCACPYSLPPLSRVLLPPEPCYSLPSLPWSLPGEGSQKLATNK